MRRIGCEGCTRTLANTEIALNLKLRGRAVSRFFCMDCLALRCDCSAEKLTELAQFYRSNGCELFAREYVKEKGCEGD